MSDFKSLDRYKIQQAFAIAHKAAQNGAHGQRERRLFRAIARAIWDAASEDGPYKSRFGAEIEDALTLAAAERGA